MGSNEVAVNVIDISKNFKLPHEKNDTIKGAVVNFWRRKKGYELLEALKDVSFNIEKGEFYGIVGRNGSGKSTLLKVLAGIYSPTEGSVTVNGRIIPFIELGVGFSPELSGRDNVFLNGALLGFSRKEMMAMYNDIVEFSELERFMDQKLKNYSSGMQVRLAFSIAIRAKGEILLIDEVLAVGDEAFQQKCLKYFRQLKKEKRTVILVSHDMDSIEKYCTKALLIHNGLVRAIGIPKDIASKYKLLNLPKKTEGKKGDEVDLVGGAEINSVMINGQKETSVRSNQDITINVVFTTKVNRPVIVSASIFQISGQHIAYSDSRKLSKNTKYKKGQRYEYDIHFSAKQFLKGAYQVEVDLRDENDIYMARQTSAVQFSVINKDPTKAGMFNLQSEWQDNS